MSTLNYKKYSTALEDNTLSLNSPNINYGTSSALTLSYTLGVENVAIIRFSKPVEITSQNLQNAILSLYQVGWVGLGDPPGEVNITIKAAFLDNSSWTEAGSNWTRPRAGATWNISGAYQSPDIVSSTVSSQIVVHDSSILGQAIQMNVTEAIRYALANNKEISLSVWIETNDSWEYASSEYSTVGYRPTIEFSYDVPQKPSRIGKKNTPKIPSL